MTTHDPTEHRSFCRICVAACGILVSVDEVGRVTKVRGDEHHPVSRGYVCSKGRGLAAWHESPGRLDHPRVRGTRATWDDALDDIAARLQRIVDDGDPSAVGVYVATGTAFDTAATVTTASWLRSIRSRSFYSAVTVDNAPAMVAAELVTGHAMMNPVWSPNRPGLLVLVGHNPVVSHGYGTAMPDPIRYLRRFREQGGRLVVIDPRRSESAALADAHLAVRPGGDVALLAAITRSLLDAGADRDELLHHCRADDVDALRHAVDRFTVERAAAATDLDVTDVEWLIDEIRAQPGRLNMFAGTGVMMSPDGVLVEWLRWALLILTGSLDRAEGMHFHDGLMPRVQPSPPDGRPHPGPVSRPDLPRVARQMPLLGLVDEIEAGNLRALVVCGGNPLSAAPEPDRIRDALAALETLVVIDVHDSPLCDLATNVLPAVGQLERADVSMFPQVAMASTVQHTEAVVAPGAERRPVWWILGHLARRMGADILGGTDPDAMTDEDFLRNLLATSPLDADTVFGNGPHGTPVPVEVGWVRREVLVDGCWNLAPPELVARLHAHEPPGPGLLLTTRREMGWSNSVRYGGQGAEPVVRMHPDELAALGPGPERRIRIMSAYGTVEASVVPDAGIRRGVVSMTHGHSGASPGALISRSSDVDPLTAMPRASAVPVTVSLAAAATDAPTRTPSVNDP